MRRFLVALAGLILSVRGAKGALVPAGVGCAPSAEAAVERVLRGATEQGGKEGFKVVAVRTDALRKRSWAMVASCTDAARPMVAIALGPGAAAFAGLAPSQQGVRLGDRVAVVREGDDSRMELAGWAEDSGGNQELIRVKMPRLSGGAEAAPVIRCRVIGKDIVEVAR